MKLRIDLEVELQVRQVRLIVKRLDETVSLLYNGFRAKEDYIEIKGTLARLDAETNELLNDLKEKTDGQDI